VNVPRARSDGLLVETLDAETLIYDTERNEAHCLDAEAAAVWRGCDGVCSLSEISARTGSSEEVAAATVRDLAARHLVEPLGVSRRDVLRTFGVGAASAAVAIPVIRSIAVPIAAQAVSCLANGDACTTYGQCCSGVCHQLVPGITVCRAPS
jgi:hypothetical protein